MNKDNSYTPRSREDIARRLAQDIPDGWYVNLGIGVPTLAANHVPEGREVIFHSENGILGIGPSPAEDEIDPWLINAGKQHVTLNAGGSYFHHADSFMMIRGRHLDLCVLGAFEVSCGGDLANWTRGLSKSAPAVGGAMDLAIGAKSVWIAMDHQASNGTPKLMQSCSYPLTARSCVDRVYTDLAVLEPTGNSFRVIEMVEGMTFDELQSVTAAPLSISEL
ncbi:3-oxoacid CoA-transferase subunit B [Planktomarina temperata]|nr:3-oxoacid CoA-transferase subunit B [Planktomarina temperata]